MKYKNPASGEESIEPSVGPILKRTDNFFLFKQRMLQRTEKLKDELEMENDKKEKNKNKKGQEAVKPKA